MRRLSEAGLWAVRGAGWIEAYAREPNFGREGYSKIRVLDASRITNWATLSREETLAPMIEEAVLKADMIRTMEMCS